MSTSRAAFLERVRNAVRAGNQAGNIATVGPRGQTGYQGAGADPVARFCEQFTAAGGTPHVVGDTSAARAKVLEIALAFSPRSVLCSRGAVIDLLELPAHLGSRGVEVHRADALHDERGRDVLFAADLGITGVEYLIAETGSLVVSAGRTEPRSLSLLPPVHIAVAARSQLLPDLFDLFNRFDGENGQAPALPSCLTIITGPSKTGDIELRLVTGVHGPGRVHAVVIA
jgi:L-lactate dehydrogenase complex protein LldG